MIKKELDKRSTELQKQFIEDNGLIGLKQSKSKVLAKDRYKCHKKLTPYFLIYPRLKTMYKESDYPDELQKYVNELVNEFGYNLQTTLK
jgi:hypothetical protein